VPNLLIEGNYLPILEKRDDNGLSLYAETLGLELRLGADGEMRFYDPKVGVKLLSPQEMEMAKRQAEQAQYQAEQKAARLAAKLRELGVEPDLI
jgi:hypothetical protein